MKARITTRTADVLAEMSLKAVAISDAVYEAGHRAEAQAINHAAQRLADSSAALRAALDAYARAALHQYEGAPDEA